MQQSKFWLKLIGTVLLIHVVLIILTIIEVAIYSYLISPGKDQAFYEAHASVSGPWISGIIGSLIMFFLVKRFIKRFPRQALSYAIWLPLLYFAIDLVLVIAAGYSFSDHVYTFVLAGIPKIIAVAMAYFIYGKKDQSLYSKSI